MEAILVMDGNNELSKKGIIPWNSTKDLHFLYTITKRNVVIMSIHTYNSLPNPFESGLIIVLDNHPELYQDSKHPYYFNTLFTNNFNIHKSILRYREKYRQFYPSLSINFKIYFIGCEKMCNQYLDSCNVMWVLQNKNCFSCDNTYKYILEKQFKEVDIDVKVEGNNIQKITKYVHSF
jgi:dihydrofolate reductase